MMNGMGTASLLCYSHIQRYCESMTKPGSGTVALIVCATGKKIGEEKVATVSRLFFFSFVATFDNFCPSVRPSVRPSVPTGNNINNNTAFWSLSVVED